MTTWTPRPDVMQHVISLFLDIGSNSNERQLQIFNEFEEIQKMPDFALYLTAILNCVDQNIPTHARATASYRLRKYIKDNYNSLNVEMIDFIKDNIISLIADQDQMLRNSVHDLFATLAPLQKLHNWGAILNQLYTMLSTEGLPRLSAMSCLFKICDELTDQEEVDPIALFNNPTLGNPLSALFPKFVELIIDPNIQVRKDSLNTLLCFIYTMPVQLTPHLPQYISNVFHLASCDGTSSIKKAVCSTFSAFVSKSIHDMGPRMNDIISFVLHCSNREDDSLALAACEFWDSLLCKDNSFVKASEVRIRQSFIERRLHDIVPVLLSCTVYTEFDLMTMSSELGDDMDFEDRDQDIKPRFHDSQRRTDDDEDEEEENDDDDDDADWNTRKAAANVLDSFARIFKDEFMKVVLPILENYLRSDNWLNREAAVLIIGAMSFGCIERMGNLLPSILPLLMELMEDEQALLRSTSCWALGCYSAYIIEASPELYLEKFLKKILACVTDRNKKVQYAACCALATFMEAADDNIIPYSLPISSCLMNALPIYKRKNIPSLLDALQTLCSSVGSVVRTPEFQNIVVCPIFQTFGNLSFDDPLIADYLILFYTIVSNLEGEFGQYASTIFGRVLDILKLYVQSIYNDYNAGQAIDSNDANVVAALLDLTSAIADNLKGSFTTLVENSDLIPLLCECLKINDALIQQPTLAVIGDVARHGNVDLLLPFLLESVSVAINCILIDEHYEDLCNNALWSIGEIIKKIGVHIKPFVPNICVKLAGVVAADEDEVSSNLFISAATILSMLSSQFHEIIAPGISSVFNVVVYYISKNKIPSDKAAAYIGISTLVKNHTFIVDTVGISAISQSLMSYKNPNHDILQNFGEMYHAIKSSHANWLELLNDIPEPHRSTIISTFSL